MSQQVLFQQRRYVLAAAALVAGVFVAAPWVRAADRTVAQAAVTPNSRAGVSSGQIADARRQLNDPDANVRMAAMENLIASDSLAVRELALQEGFSSPDSVLRSLALIGRLQVTPVLIFEILNNRNLPPEEWAKVLQAFYNTEKLTFSQVKFDPKTGQITCNGGAVTGRLAGQTIALTWGNHSLLAKLGEGAALTGTVSVVGGGTVTVRAQLQ